MAEWEKAPLVELNVPGHPMIAVRTCVADLASLFVVFGFLVFGFGGWELAAFFLSRGFRRFWISAVAGPVCGLVSATILYIRSRN